MLLLFPDSNILASLVHPEFEENAPIAVAMFRILRDRRIEVSIPEIVDYELRRKLLHLARHPHHPRKWAREALAHLDEMANERGYIALTTETMKLAAEIWADSRARGRSRDHEKGLDVDVILAAQAHQRGAYIVTTNEKHFREIAPVFDWRPYQP